MIPAELASAEASIDAGRREAILALRRAAGALLVVADTRLAVTRALDGHGPMPSLATFADDRAAAVSALSEALRVAPTASSTRAWLLLFAEALAAGAEGHGEAERAAHACDCWANYFERAAKGAPDAA